MSSLSPPINTIRDNLLMDWVNETVSNRLDESNRFLAVLVQRTGLMIPKARNLQQYITEQQHRPPRGNKQTKSNRSRQETASDELPSSPGAIQQQTASALSQFNESMGVLDNFRDLGESCLFHTRQK
jgi:hypothetical protein